MAARRAARVIANAGRCFCLALIGLCGLMASAGGADIPVSVDADSPAPPGATSRGPVRIASLNLCLDQMLLALVPPRRIVSLTFLAADPSASALADRVGDIHLNRGLAEELIPLRPDLVLAGEYNAGAAVSLLRRLGLRVETVALPRRLRDIRAHIREMGVLLGAEEKAAAMLAEMDSQLKRLRESSPRAPARRQRHREGTAGGKMRALYYSPNGVTFGPGTLEHELLVLAGFENIAASMGIEGYAHLPLERLVQARPQRLVINDSGDGGFSIARDNLRHPVLKRIVPPEHLIRLPRAMSACSAPFIVPLLEALTGETLQ